MVNCSAAKSTLNKKKGRVGGDCSKRGKLHRIKYRFKLILSQNSVTLARQTFNNIIILFIVVATRFNRRTHYLTLFTLRNNDIQLLNQ